MIPKSQSEIDEAAALIRTYNQWRRSCPLGGNDLPMPDPIAVGKALDVVLDGLRDAQAEIDRYAKIDSEHSMHVLITPEQFDKYEVLREDLAAANAENDEVRALNICVSREWSASKTQAAMAGQLATALTLCMQTCSAGGFQIGAEALNKYHATVVTKETTALGLNWRDLYHGELIEVGDECFHGGKWIEATSTVGLSINFGSTGTRTGPHRRRVNPPVA